jgi:hypothetical protein
LAISAAILAWIILRVLERVDAQVKRSEDRTQQ